MKARELVEKLQKHDPETEVFIQQSDSRGRSIADSVTLNRVTNWDHKNNGIHTESFILIGGW